MPDDRRFQAHKERKWTWAEIVLVGTLIAFFGWLAIIAAAFGA